MPSKSSVEFLERQKVVERPQRGILHSIGTNAANFRNIKYPSEILPSDTPTRRVLTQPQEERVAFASPCCREGS